MGATSAVIDGAVHPELIPDSTAYRLYFVTVSTRQAPTDEDQKCQRAHLNKIGLKDGDLGVMVEILTEFRMQHDALVGQYNQAAERATARDEVPDTAGFLRQLDGLVQSTRDTLKLRLTPGAMTQLDAFVQSEKKHMNMHTGGQ